jgi:hypothetical protein
MSAKTIALTGLTRETFASPTLTSIPYMHTLRLITSSRKRACDHVVLFDRATEGLTAKRPITDGTDVGIHHDAAND